jgi:hypothetical protein
VRPNAPRKAAQMSTICSDRVRPVRSFGLVVLMLAIISIPLMGTPAPHASALLPLATHFVPFGASVQIPEPVVQSSFAAASTRRVTFAPNTIAFPSLRYVCLVSCRASNSNAITDAMVPLSGRAPPRA